MNLALKLKTIHDLMEKMGNREAVRLDVTFSQHHVLMYLLRRKDENVRLKELEKEFGVAQSTMAGIISRLEDKALVRSFRDPSDHRIKMVRLTEKGIEICEQSRENMQAAMKVMLSRMSEEEEAELNRLLDILYETIREDLNKEDGK